VLLLWQNVIQLTVWTYYPVPSTSHSWSILADLPEMEVHLLQPHIMRIRHNRMEHIKYISKATDKWFLQGNEVMPDWQDSSPVVSHWSEAPQLHVRPKTTGSDMVPWIDSHIFEHEQLHQPSQVVDSCNASSCLMCLVTSPLGSKIPFLPVICAKHFWEILSMFSLTIFNPVLQCRM